MRMIILEYNFDFKQKAILLVLMSFPLLKVFSFFYNFQNLKHSDNLITNYILVIICIIITLVLFIIAFSKKGLIYQDGNLYLSYTIYKKNIYRKNVDLQGKTSFTILKNKVNQKNSYLSAGGADLSYKYFEYDIILLDDNNLNKKIMTVKTIEHANSLKLFLEGSTYLKYTE